MTTDVAVRLRQTTRDLVVLWQNPSTRALLPVATLTATSGREPSYQFRYGPDVDDMDGFEPLLAFPDRNGTYTSHGDLFPFFANRVMSPRRPDYQQYVEALGLDGDEHDPIEILARSGGQRATDTMQVVEMPQRRADGALSCLFLVSGVRHVQAATEHIEHLAAGAHLTLLPEPDNEWNPHALRVADGVAMLGYLPDYLVAEVRDGRDAEWGVSVKVEVANSRRAPAHLRLLCRLELTPSTVGSA